MSGSDQHDRVSLVCVDDQAHIGGIVNRNLIDIDFTVRQTVLQKGQEVLRRVAHDTEPVSTIQMVCDHPPQIFLLQKEIANLKSQQFLPAQCDQTEIKNHIWILTAECDKFKL